MSWIKPPVWKLSACVWQLFRAGIWKPPHLQDGACCHNGAEGAREPVGKHARAPRQTVWFRGAAGGTRGLCQGKFAESSSRHNGAVLWFTGAPSTDLWPFHSHYFLQGISWGSSGTGQKYPRRWTLPHRSPESRKYLLLLFWVFWACWLTGRREAGKEGDQFSLILFGK